MATDFDAVVIGSGFGGAVSALRLAEGGYRVLVLERGRRWHRLEYPSVTRSDWLWDEAHPERTNGWLTNFPTAPSCCARPLSSQASGHSMTKSI